MFRQGRVSASAGFAIIVAVVFFMVLHEEVAEAAPTTYTVGGAGGWTFNVAAWPKGKRFKAGDTLGTKNANIFMASQKTLERLRTERQEKIDEILAYSSVVGALSSPFILLIVVFCFARVKTKASPSDFMSKCVEPIVKADLQKDFL